MDVRERRQELQGIADFYAEDGYNTVAVDQTYPGIFEDEVPQHEVQGSVDILLEDEFIDGSLKLLEVGFTESTSSDTIRSMFNRKQEKAEKNAEYFENLGYDVDYEAMVKPSGSLKAVREIFQQTTGVFTWNQAVDAVSDKGHLGGLKGDEIILQGISPMGTELYELNEEYEELVDLFREENFYP